MIGRTFENKYRLDTELGAVRQMLWLSNVEGRWLITDEKDLKIIRHDR